MSTAGDNLALLDAIAPESVEGLYLHVPFCFHKCHYCDFYSIVDDRDRQRGFTDRMIAEVRAAGRRMDGPIRSIFVGGGTPTLLAVEHWARLLEALGEAFDLTHLAEFTVEANPETVTADLLATLAVGGVNRLSIGCQSFNPTHLKTLERWHEPANVARSIDLARAAGIHELNLDLIFAIPGQTLDDWRADLAAAVDLGPTHLSAYGLMYEPNTPLTQKMQRGRIERADEDLETAMYRLAMEHLDAAGFEQYEISNWAKRSTAHGGPQKTGHSTFPKNQNVPFISAGGGGEGVAAADHRCAHNLLYWRSGNWFAIGPSASGHLDGVRWKNLLHLGRYLASGAHGAGAPITDVEQLDPVAAVGERLMMWLRLRDGVPNDWLAGHLDPGRAAVMDDLIGRGLLERTDQATRLTDRGLMIADSVVAELL